MIVEERDYRLVQGKTAQFLSIYREFGLPVQRRHLGEPFGFFVTDIGELNHVVSLWRYQSYEDRAQRRAAMLADAEWPLYISRIPGLIDVQVNRILTPAFAS
jgi:hypothetical protein